MSTSRETAVRTKEGGTAVTVNEAIEIACPSFPSEIERALLVRRLDELEARIALELYGSEHIGIGSDGEQKLSAPDAYAEVYPIYLMMKRELDCADAERYAFYSAAFEEAYSRLAAYIGRSAIRPSTAVKLLGD